MNKLFTTLVILISTVCTSHAQVKYIKYLKDCNYNYKSKIVYVFKGEIVPFINGSLSNNIDVIIGADTIRDVRRNSTTFDTVTPLKVNYLSSKDDLLQQKNEDFIYVNINSINISDTAVVYAESGMVVTTLVKARNALISLADCGKTFRLVISNTPTIYYSATSLKQFAEPGSVPGHENTESQKEERRDAGWSMWQKILLGIIALGSIGVGGWWLIKGRNSIAETNQEPIYAAYNNNKSLSNFAIDHHIDLDILLQYNKNVINKKYIRYNDSDRKKVQAELKNRKLIVGFKVKGIAERNLGHTETRDETMPKECKQPEVTFDQQTNYGINNELVEQLRQMENNLINEIKLGRSGSNNQNEINRLRNEKTEVVNRLREVENDKKNSDSKQIRLEADKSTLESNLQNANDDKNRIKNEIKELKEKVIAVEFLKGYSESVFDYLEYCQQVSIDAFNFFGKISQQNPKQAFAAGHLLVKFQSAVNAIPVGDWLRTVQDIKDSGATTNQQLTRSFSQIQNDNDKQKEFQRLLFSKVLTKYSSNILILAEAFKNLSRFQDSAAFAGDAQVTFGKHVTEIVNKAKSTGLEIKYVPLFDNWEKYLGQVEDNGEERSFAYKEISGLEKGAITEIVSYGVKSTIGDDTKTIIILA